MKKREELTMDALEQVSGGNYVNVSMSLGDIIETNRNLTSFLIEAGIPATGNKAMLGMSLYEAAELRGIDPYTLEDRMNDYLSSN